MSVIEKQLIGDALYFTGPRAVEVHQELVPTAKNDEVLIEVLCSGISSGTEMNVYRGLAPQWQKRQDPETKLFVATDQPDWQYPSRYGYASVGRILEVGSDVQELSKGDLVFSYTPHGSYAVASSQKVIVLPELKSVEHGVFFANLSTALNGVLDTQPIIGETIVVTGLGVIGQLVVRLLAKMGLEQLIAVDTIASRRDLALKGGATHTLDPSEGSVAEHVRDLTQGRGADRVIEVSGAAPALNEAIRTVGYNGLVVAMSWYGGTFESLNLSGEFHHNRPRIISSQVASVNPFLGPMWNTARRTELVKRYLLEFDFDVLITHKVPLTKAAELYHLLDTQPENVLQIVFRYR
jgi:2-desacetyl-2-hydroxyethyl bacteriochlorophyllide A dehydrogenase